ncbi:MAG: hypothetical protein IPM84_09465 [Anaerolineae bacterium]|nr:hypothetical protein [Anaerolineae bacterium]
MLPLCHNLCYNLVVRHPYNLWGCEVGIKFPVVKLLDYRADWVIQLPPELSAAFFTLTVHGARGSAETGLPFGRAGLFVYRSNRR